MLQGWEGKKGNDLASSVYIPQHILLLRDSKLHGVLQGFCLFFLLVFT